MGPSTPRAGQGDRPHGGHRPALGVGGVARAFPRGLFQSMSSPAGEQIILERNVFVERILPASVVRGLTEPEMEVYRRPYNAEAMLRAAT